MGLAYNNSYNTETCNTKHLDPSPSFMASSVVEIKNITVHLIEFK